MAGADIMDVYAANIHVAEHNLLQAYKPTLDQP